MTTAIATPEVIVNANDIHENVREYYGSRVRNATSCCGPASTSCCGPTTVEDNPWDNSTMLYSGEELADIPTDAAHFSLGCGNPTAIASLKMGEVVLDLGSGGGIDVLLAARQVGPTGYVYGVDMTDEMLALARRNAAKMGAENVEFRKGHIEDLPLSGQSVDVIISNCVVNLSPDKGQTLQEAFRVLKPGGRLAISDIVIDGGLDDLPIDESKIRAALSWAGCIAGALTVNQYRELLTQAGFESIEIPITHHYRLEDLGQDIDTIALNWPLDVAKELVSRFGSASISAYRR